MRKLKRCGRELMVQSSVVRLSTNLFGIEVLKCFCSVCVSQRDRSSEIKLPWSFKCLVSRCWDPLLKMHLEDFGRWIMSGGFRITIKTPGTSSWCGKTSLDLFQAALLHHDWQPQLQHCEDLWALSFQGWSPRMFHWNSSGNKQDKNRERVLPGRCYVTYQGRSKL